MSTESKGTVLIIEDAPGMRRVYSDAIEHEGYRVLTAEDGEEGWALATSADPDLILLDLVLPKVGGLEVLKRIRDSEKTKDVIVIVFSVLGDGRDVERALELGANDYLVKGFYGMQEVLSRIRYLVAKSRVRRTHRLYRVRVAEGHGDAGKLRTDLGVTETYRCPDCDTPVVLEMMPSHTGSWFLAHFVCPVCEKSF